MSTLGRGPLASADPTQQGEEPRETSQEGEANQNLALPADLSNSSVLSVKQPHYNSQKYSLTFVQSSLNTFYMPGSILGQFPSPFQGH